MKSEQLSPDTPWTFPLLPFQTPQYAFLTGSDVAKPATVLQLSATIDWVAEAFFLHPSDVNFGSAYWAMAHQIDVLSATASHTSYLSGFRDAHSAIEPAWARETVKVALILTEVAEAIEALNGLSPNHADEALAEGADVAIRILDWADGHCPDFGEIVVETMTKARSVKWYGSTPTQRCWSAITCCSMNLGLYIDGLRKGERRFPLMAEAFAAACALARGENIPEGEYSTTILDKMVANTRRPKLHGNRLF